MAATVEELKTVFSCDLNKFKKGVKEAQNELTEFKETAEKPIIGHNPMLDDTDALNEAAEARKKFYATTKKNIGLGIDQVGMALTMSGLAQFPDQVKALGMSSVYAYGRLNALEKSLSAVGDGTVSVKEQMSSLREIAKLPGLSLEDAARGSVNLQVLGMSAKEAERTLQLMGNAVASVGGGAEDMSMALVGFTQMWNKGKINAQDLYQMTDRIPQIRAMMKDIYGTADTEKIAEMGISSKEFLTAILKQMEKLKKVDGGVANDIENFETSIEELKQSVGEALVPEFNLLANAIGNVSEFLQGMNPKVKNVVLVTAQLSALGIAAATLIFNIKRGIMEYQYWQEMTAAQTAAEETETMAEEDNTEAIEGNSEAMRQNALAAEEAAGAKRELAAADAELSAAENDMGSGAQEAADNAKDAAKDIDHAGDIAEKAGKQAEKASQGAQLLSKAMNALAIAGAAASAAVGLANLAANYNERDIPTKLKVRGTYEEDKTISKSDNERRKRHQEARSQLSEIRDLQGNIISEADAIYRRGQSMAKNRPLQEVIDEAEQLKTQFQELDAEFLKLAPWEDIDPEKQYNRDYAYNLWKGITDAITPAQKAAVAAGKKSKDIETAWKELGYEIKSLQLEEWAMNGGDEKTARYWQSIYAAAGEYQEELKEIEILEKDGTDASVQRYQLELKYRNATTAALKKYNEAVKEQQKELEQARIDALNKENEWYSDRLDALKEWADECYSINKDYRDSVVSNARDMYDELTGVFSKGQIAMLSTSNVAVGGDDFLTPEMLRYGKMKTDREKYVKDYNEKAADRFLFGGRQDQFKGLSENIEKAMKALQDRTGDKYAADNNKYLKGLYDVTVQQAKLAAAQKGVVRA